MAAPARFLMALVHAATVFLGAFLLFPVRPPLSKWVLPGYAGGPAIWTTCLAFFPPTLRGGDADVHLGERFLPRSLRLLAHRAGAGAASMLCLAPERPSSLDHPTESISCRA